jgi:hypothetical protein
MNSIDETFNGINNNNNNNHSTKMVNSKNVSLFLLDDHHQSNTSNERLEDEEDDLIEQMPIIDDDMLNNDDAMNNNNNNNKNYRQLIQVELESLHHNNNQNLLGNKTATIMTMMSSPESALMPSSSGGGSGGNTQDISFQDAQDTDLDVVDFNSKSPPSTVNDHNHNHNHHNNNSFLGEMILGDKMKELEKKNKHLQATLERIYEKDDLFMASSRRENEERENSIKLLRLDIDHLNNEKNTLQVSNQNLSSLLSKALLISSSIEENINKRLTRIIQSQSYSNGSGNSDNAGEKNLI